MPAFRSTPFTVPVHELEQRPGEHRRVEFDVDAPEQLGEGLAVVSQGAELEVEALLESVHEGILVSGTVTATADATCARCLQPFRLPIEVEFQELFAYSLDDGFDVQLTEHHVDLEPVIRDAVVLALPFQPIDPAGCEPTPLGEGIRLVLSDESTAPEPDPRWAALAQFGANVDDEGTTPKPESNPKPESTPKHE